MRRLAILSLVVASVLAGGRPSAQPPSVPDQLDRYLAGQFAAVVEGLRAASDFGRLLEELRRDGRRWVESGRPQERTRRQLAAATFALEAARAGAWIEWKLIQKQPQMCASNNECIQPPNVLYWKAPPLLIEWGCELLRQDAKPRPVERWWQLAALSVAQRAEDPQFLVGDTSIGKGIGAGEIVNTQDDITHLEHVTPRFPQEMRFLLAQGIARSRSWPDEARMVFRTLEKDPDVGGEATMRLGALLMPPLGRSNYMTPGGGSVRLPPSTNEALELFDRADDMTRDPYVIYLARYFKGKLLEAERKTEEAEAAYRGAVTAVPHAQSATISLATLLFRDGRRSESQRLIAEMLAHTPRPADPWRTFVHADDRFWPQLVGRLRAEILK